MGIMGALYTGISGMTANGISISVIGDNIANINTVGFKSSRTTFQNVLTQAVTGLGVMGISQIGQGVALQTIDRAFTQGSLITTENVTDLAITGRGSLCFTVPIRE
jgi:flagellar hook protein FlgE